VFPRYYVGFQKNCGEFGQKSRFLSEIRDKNREKSRRKSNIKFLTTKLEFLRGMKLAGWGGSFLMVYRNNAGRLGAGFISVCL